jgi:hypothetical protein
VLTSSVRVVLTAAAVAVLGMVSGCGQPASVGPRQAAVRFADASASGDGEKACAALAPATSSEIEQSEGEPCPKAVIAENLPRAGAVRQVQVFGTMAQVRLQRDTMFVSRFPIGWRVVAAGCKPAPGHPYDCQVQGG